MRRLILTLAFLALATGCGDDDATARGSGPPTEPPDGLTDAEWGEHLFRSRGCVACHSIHGQRIVGAPLGGIWESERSLVGGETAIVDETYLRESILRPGAKIVEGYAPQMPSYEGVLAEAELAALVAYLRALD